MTLDQLALNRGARIISIDWTAIAESEGKRLRALGFEPGADISVAYRGVLGGADPLAVALGTMQIALRRSHAAAISVEPQA